MKNNNNEGSKDLRTEKRKIGDKGEEEACAFLVKQGFFIVERNYLRKYGEIDIVALKNGVYHFVEVKTVTNITKGGYRAEDNVHPWKLKRLSRVIQAYILEKKLFNSDWHFDVIVVQLVEGKSHIALLEDLVL